MAGKPTIVGVGDVKIDKGNAFGLALARPSLLAAGILRSLLITDLEKAEERVKLLSKLVPWLIC